MSFTAEERMKYIGGSDISAIMGMNRWKTPLKLWLEKTGEAKPDDLSKVEAVQLGIELEEFVAQKFARESGKQVRKQSKMYVHPDYDYMVAHIDRLITGEDEILECKTCSAYKSGEWEDGIPQEYILQVQWYLGITGRRKAYIAVLIGGQSFKYKEIEFDKELFDVMVERAIEFWNCVKTLNPPPISANDGETLQEMFPKSSGDIIEMQDLEDKVAYRQELKEQVKQINNELAMLETELKNNIKSNLGFSTFKYIVTWKEQSNTSIDSSKLTNDGLFDKYKKTTEFRVLKVKKNPNYEPPKVA